MINYILNIIGLILIIKWFKIQILDFKGFKNKTDYFKLKRFKSIIITFFLLLIPVLVINYTSIESNYHIDNQKYKDNKYLFSLLVSFFISAVWFVYIYRLDIFNKEKKRHLFFVFILSCVFTIFAQYPYEIIHSLGLVKSNNLFDDFLYSVFGIGFIEETIKLIPLLIILKFSKAIDEPYDYILYASIAALGFSFVENTMYLNNYGLHIINARALYATVAHMTFSSMIAYGMFLVKYKKTKVYPIIILLVFYFLAMLSHGFYDFWILNKTLVNFKGLTTLFLLTTIHIWFVMKNNTINSSNYFNDNQIVNNDKLKIYLIISLISIFMFSYVFVAFKWNSTEANLFFVKSVHIYGYVIFYLIATLSKYRIVKGFIKPFKLNFKYFIPKKKQV